jgi:hypothetical protein
VSTTRWLSIAALALAASSSCKKKSEDTAEKGPAAGTGDEQPVEIKDAAAALACPDDLSSLRSLFADAGDATKIEACLAVKAPEPALYVAAVEGDPSSGGDVIVREQIVTGSLEALAIKAQTRQHLGGMAAVRWSGPFTAAVDLDGDGVDELALEGEADQGGETVQFVEAARIAGGELQRITSFTTGFDNAAQIVDDEVEPTTCTSEVEIVELDPEVGHGAIVVRAAGPSTASPCPPRGTTRWIARGDALVQFEK